MPRLCGHCHLSGEQTDVVSRDDLVMETLGSQMLTSKESHFVRCPASCAQFFPCQLDLISLHDPVWLTLRDLTQEPLKNVLKNLIRICQPVLSLPQLLFYVIVCEMLLIFRCLLLQLFNSIVKHSDGLIVSQCLLFFLSHSLSSCFSLG